MNAANVRMRDLAGHPDLVVKTRPGFVIRRRFEGQEFQGNLLSEFQVVRAIDFAHASFPDESRDAVALGD